MIDKIKIGIIYIIVIAVLMLIVSGIVDASNNRAFCNKQGYPSATIIDINNVLCYGSWGSEVFEHEIFE